MTGNPILRGYVSDEYFCDREKYYTFLIDIYATKTLADIIQELCRNILQSLKSKGNKGGGAFS